MRTTIARRRIVRSMATGLLLLTLLSAVPALAASGWIVFCTYSHSAKDDPIVFPGVTDASHLHDFFGNSTTEATSTNASMLGSDTTCATRGDTAAFWVPALFKDGGRVLPQGAPAAGTQRDYHARTQVYYANNLTGLAPSAIEPLPAGLRMVAGVSTATRPKENPLLGREIYWGCSNNQPDEKFTAPVDCATGIESLHIGFPNCWDGVHLDSPDHRSHMAFPVEVQGGYVCPKDHPVPIPRVILRIEYPIGTDASGITLSSGKTFTAHGDFWNTWDQPALAQLTTRCLNADIDCGVDPDPSSAGVSSPWPKVLWGLVGLGILLTAFVAGFRSAKRPTPPRNGVGRLRQMDVPP